MALFGGFEHVTGYLTSEAFTVAGVTMLWAEVAVIATSLYAVANAQTTKTGISTAGATLLVSSVAFVFSSGLTSWVSGSASKSLLITAITAVIYIATIEGREIGGAVKNVTN
ncbi:MAG: hypothetical protein H8Z69_03880 [Nanohaloarchaea archaeon]|nr:hypothetical protein [Candidatus Nanohaloarchaea archaeon]